MTRSLTPLEVARRHKDYEGRIGPRAEAPALMRAAPAVIRAAPALMRAAPQNKFVAPALDEALRADLYSSRYPPTMR